MCLLVEITESPRRPAACVSQIEELLMMRSMIKSKFWLFNEVQERKPLIWPPNCKGTIPRVIPIA